jgi:non-specific serine/threonine protein kinase
MRKLSPKQREALEAIAARRILPALCREEDGWHARWRGVPDDGNPWLDSLVREAIASPLCADAESRRYETVHDAWLAALQSRTGLVARDPAECEALAADLEEWRGSADASPEDRRAVAFSLVQRGETVSVECEVPKGRRALRALGQAAYVFPPLKDMRRAHGADGKSVLSVSLNQREAEDFVRVGAKELSDAGYPVRGVPPPSLVDAAVDVAETTAGVDVPPSQPREFEAKVTVRVDGEPVNAEEVRFLLDQKSTFVFFRNRWIEVDRGVLKEALRVLERQSVRRIGLNEAVAFVAGVGCAGTLDVAEANAHGWIRGLVNELKSRTVCQAASPTAVLSGFEGELRPYQKRGVAWMRFLTGNGFGALLADDMGLGKTVQTIAWMASLHGRRNGASAPFLVVAPVTLLANWRREIGRFAPTFKVVVHHGASRNPGEILAAAVSDADVVLTSYPVFVKDYPFLRRIRWDGLVLDEAQTIRNHETRAARAASALGAPRRVALTGTPVENSVADIWSIENCLNPGFLGDRKSFVERYAEPASIGPGGPAAARLAAALEPFVLRRLKTDPAVAAEIGPKQEKVEYCELTPLQIREYEDAVSSYRRGTGRRGDALALITRLKLVCDGLHVGADGAPDAAAFAAGGKFLRLAELLDSIFAAGESALVFTQYAKVGAMLKTALETRFARPAPFLHGSLSAAAREAEIAKFRSSTAPSAFVLSVKAGGLGLNLVKATRVVHFDRWWNPAVEAQATDRAHRIGQANAVFVHKFVAEGTLEERVDAIIERKAGAAGAAVVSGESFLMSLADDELLETVSLRRGEAARG